MDGTEQLAAIAHSPAAKKLREMIAALPSTVLMDNHDVAYVGGALARWQGQFPKPAAPAKAKKA